MAAGAAVEVTASSVVPPDFPQLVNESDYIVRAVVKSVTAEKRLAPSGATLVFSRVELDVKQVVAGKPPSPLVLDVMGGKIDDLEVAIAGAPKFTEGEESIFFVQGNGRQVYPLVRMMHGFYRIQKETARSREYMARSDGAPLRNVSEVSRPIHDEQATAAPSSEEMAQALSPDDFIMKIRAAATKTELREY